MIYKLIEKILDQAMRIKKFRNYVDYRANHIYFGNGFINNPSNGTINEVFSEYNFSDIQPTDIVLDIGANVGAFSMFMARMVEHVYAVEPMIADVLRTNVNNNKIENITIIEECLGEGITEISWMNNNKTMKGKSLHQLIKLCGGHIDFLKCDCEGGEWIIKPEELKGIRRVEMEVHNLNDDKNFDNFLKLMTDAGFRYTYNIPKKTDMLIHAFQR